MSSSRRSPLVRLALPVFVPSFIWSSGYSALDPVVVIGALSLGFTQSRASALSGLSGLVIVLCGPLIGSLITRIGDRRAFILGTLIAETALAGLLTSLLAPHKPWVKVVYVLGLIALAVASNLWSLARQAYVAESLPPTWRARGMSMLGAMLRLGMMVGPGVGALAIAWWDLPGALWYQVVATLVALGFILAFTLPSPQVLMGGAPDEPVAPGPQADTAASASQPTRPMREKPDLRAVVTLASCVLVLGIVRTNRAVIIPLLGSHMGIPVEVISLTFAISTVLDVAVFYPSGRLSDRFGRRASLIPTMLTMGVGFVVLSQTSSVAGFIAASSLIGLGNGLGAGIIMTMGADLSPDVDRSRFLGLWQSLSTIGTVAGPFLVSATVWAAGVVWAAVVTGVLALVGAAWSWFLVPVAYRWIGIDERGRPLPVADDAQAPRTSRESAAGT